MKYLRVLLIIFATTTVAMTGMWLIAGRLISGAFDSASREGDFNRLADVLEARVGSTLARGDFRLQLGEVTNQAALEYYKRNPQQMKRDKAYFETWRSALTIAQSGLENGHQLNGWTVQWTSTTNVIWISQSNKLDAWGHTFCVHSNASQTIVVSPGPNAVSSFDCKTVNVSEKELAQMSGGRLNLHSSGAVILFVKRRGESHHQSRSKA